MGLNGLFVCSGVLWDGVDTDVKLQQQQWTLLLPVVVSHTAEKASGVKRALTPFCSHLFASPQALPPSSSQWWCCCCWHCCWLVPSCGTSGECAGELCFQYFSTQPSIVHLVLTSMSILASLSLLPFDNHLFPVSQVSMAGQISFSVLAVTFITFIGLHNRGGWWPSE